MSFTPSSLLVATSGSRENFVDLDVGAGHFTDDVTQPVSGLFGLGRRYGQPASDPTGTTVHVGVGGCSSGSRKRQKMSPWR